MSNNPTRLMPSDLAALLCARICHDLISPVGALGTALEVLDDDANADMHADALDLVRLAARQASAKLQFLRLAFGAGTSAPGQIGQSALMELINGIYGDGKVSVTWEKSGINLEKVHARLLLNMMMMAAQSIPRGGEVVISVSETDAVDIKTEATGRRARLEDNVPKTLSGQSPEDGFDGRSIQPFYTGLIVRELKGKIAASIVEETVAFTATIPKL